MGAAPAGQGDASRIASIVTCEASVMPNRDMTAEVGLVHILRYTYCIYMNMRVYVYVCVYIYIYIYIRLRGT